MIMVESVGRRSGPKRLFEIHFLCGNAAYFLQSHLNRRDAIVKERREKLEDLLRKKNIYDDLDDEIPDDA